MKKTAYVLILLSLVFALPNIALRYRVENKNNKIKILVDPDTGFVSQGLTILKESTLADWESAGFVDICGPAIQTPFNSQNTGLVLAFSHENKFHQAYKVLNLKLSGLVEQRTSSGLYYIKIIGFEKKEIMDIGLGVSISSSSGETMCMLLNDKWVNLEYINWVFSANISSVFFAGEQVLGYPDLLPVVENKLLENNVDVYMEEFHRPKGISEVLSKARVVRMHSVPEDIDIQTAMSRIIRAVRERGIRLVYLNDSISSQKIEKLYTTLSKNSFVEGLPSAIDMPVSFSIFSMLSLPLFILGFALLVRSRILSIFAISTISITLFYFDNLSSLYALISALFFPIASIYMLKNNKAGFFKNLFLIISMTLFASLFIASLSAKTEYLIKINQHFGIKFALLLPILAGALLMFSKEEFSLDKALTRLEFLIICFLSLSSVIYLLRSSNSAPALVSGFELKFRVLLENIFIYRPRLKEFLIGHPLLITGLYYLKLKKNVIPAIYSKSFILFGFVGQLSIINTFMHIHSPIVVSLSRTIVGLLIGTVFSFALIFVVGRCRHHLK